MTKKEFDPNKLPNSLHKAFNKLADTIFDRVLDGSAILNIPYLDKAIETLRNMTEQKLQAKGSIFKLQHLQAISTADLTNKFVDEYLRTDLRNEGVRKITVSDHTDRGIKVTIDYSEDVVFDAITFADKYVTKKTKETA